MGCRGQWTDCHAMFVEKIFEGKKTDIHHWNFLANEEMKKLATDAMFKLEYDGKDVAKKSDKSTPDLTELEMHQSAWKDDYIINYVLRKNLRVRR